jgi:molybdenum cofactor synthesis domain-containing protein
MKSAGVVVIGNEVLSGKVEEENARFLIRELRELGVLLSRMTFIRDEVEAIAQEVRAQSDAFDVVFTTGGVGSTHDDVTLPAIAKAFDVPLQVHPVLRQKITAHYGVAPSEALLRMATVPSTAQLVGEETLLFPLVQVRNVYVLPGVPKFMRAKFAVLRSFLQDRPFAMRQVFLNVREDKVAELLADVAAVDPGLEVGSYPSFDEGEFSLKVTLESKDPELVERSVEKLLDAMDERWIVRVV